MKNQFVDINNNFYIEALNSTLYFKSVTTIILIRAMFKVYEFGDPIYKYQNAKSILLR